MKQNLISANESLLPPQFLVVMGKGIFQKSMSGSHGKGKQKITMTSCFYIAAKKTAEVLRLNGRQAQPESSFLSVIEPLL